MSRARHLVRLAGLVAIVTAGCATPPPTPARTSALLVEAGVSDAEVQALVMEMADDYNASLSEAVYLLAREGSTDPTARWLAQSFLRNGMGASLDIAVGPNPAVSVLDLLVLSALQTWSFEEHWSTRGFDDDVADRVLQRLHAAEASAWTAAERLLTPEQLATLRSLVQQWIKVNDARVVVAFVRFDDFTDERLQPSSTARDRAGGLLRELTAATAAVDDARLLGERVLWYAGRYPYIVGQQSELTAYRMLDQPEIQQAFAALEGFDQMTRSLSARLDTLDRDLIEQQEVLFDQLEAERIGAIRQAEAALARVAADAAADVDRRLAEQREAFVAVTFDRFAEERGALLDEIDARKDDLTAVMVELRETIATSNDLASTLTGTVDAIDRVVSRFDRDPNDTREPLQMADVRDAAVETGLAAQELTTLLKAADRILLSDIWDNRLGQLDNSTAGLIDRLFWRGLVLILIFLTGLALIRLIPRRTTAPRVSRA